MAKLTAHGAKEIARFEDPKTGAQYVIRSDAAVLRKYRGAGTWNRIADPRPKADRPARMREIRAGFAVNGIRQIAGLFEAFNADGERVVVTVPDADAEVARQDAFGEERLNAGVRRTLEAISPRYRARMQG